MDKDQLIQLGIGAAVLTAGVLVKIFGPQPANLFGSTTPTFTQANAQKEAKVAKEKTEALKALFETDAFKNGTAVSQRQLIEAIDRTYM